MSSPSSAVPPSGSSRRALRASRSSGSDAVGSLLLLAALVLGVTAYVLLRTGPDVTVDRYSIVDESSDDSPVEVTTTVECIAVGSGTDGSINYSAQDDTLSEQQLGSNGNDARGLRDGEAADLCGLARDARIARAMETGFLALLATGGWVLVGVRRRIDERAED